MKTQRPALRLRASILAVHGALGWLAAAQAQAEPTVAELTRPTSTLEVGAGSIGSYSAKANEYTGLRQSGAYPIVNFDLRGGAPYDSPDAARWQLTGSDLGTQRESLAADYSLQGSFRVRLGYDELLRNQSDSYQSPYLGAGSRNLQLPSNWMTVVVPRLSGTTPNARGLSPAVTGSSAIVGGVLTAPTAAQAATAKALQAADLPAFAQVDLFTKRTGYTLGWDQFIGSRWKLSFSVADEHKQGLKPLGAHSHATGGDVSSILPIPIDQHDRKATIGASFTGEKLQLQAVFDVSAFTNNVPSVSSNLWSGPGITATMSTAPSNLFEKLSLSGSYQIAPKTSVVGNASYARTWQNDSFLSDPTLLIAPATSAQARVVNQSFGLKAFNRSVKSLTLSAGYQYDQRENRTPINTYVFYDNNEAPAGTSPFQYKFPGLPGLGNNINIGANTPYSRRVQQVHLDADWQLRPGDHLKAGWNTSRTDRYCIDSWVDCVNASHATENTLHADWFGNPMTDLSARVGLSASRRTVDKYNENAFLARVPMASQTPTGAPAGSTAYDTMISLGLNGYGPPLGLTPAAAAGSALGFYFPLNNALNNIDYGYRNRISELLGMRRFDQADRDRGRLRSALTWQATDKLELQGGFDFTQDRYGDSVYGLQRASEGALNLDAVYAAGEDFNVGAFASLEERRTRIAGNSYTANSAAANVNGATAIVGGCFPTIASRNASNKIDPCENWASNTRDHTLTFGVTAAKNRLLAGKLDLWGSLTYSDARTDIDASGGSYVNNPYAGIAAAANGTVAAYFVPATALPTITSRWLDLRLSGTYRIGRDSAVRLSYGYQRLISADWGYDGMQDGVLTQVLPTREQAPNYHVNSVGLAFITSFR